MFGSACSGIEAASVAWHPLGWRAAWFSEIEPFPCAVLAHHYPDTPNLGDMTTIKRRVLTGEVVAPDVFTAGTPCQAFSVAGLRRSLEDARGNLSLTFCEIADAIDHVRRLRGEPACIVVWENVPGVLSTADNAFGCFLAGLAGEDEPLQPPGSRWSDAGAVYGPARAVAWRTLDAQYFGLAQRRRRVFVVASAREGFDPAAVLLEWQGVRRDTAPRREAGEDAADRSVAGTLRSRHNFNTNEDAAGSLQPVAFGGNRTSGARDVASALSAHGGTGRHDFETETFVAQSLRGEGFDASEDGTGRGTPLVPVAYAPDVHPTIVARSSRGGGQTNSPGHNADATLVAYSAQDYEAGTFAEVEQAAPLTTSADRSRAAPLVTAFSAKDYGGDASDDLAPTLRAMPHDGRHANGGGQMAVAVDTRNAAVGGPAHTLQAAGIGSDRGGNPNAIPHVMAAMQVRRLTPRECERLQGFPDDYTLIPWRGKPASECPDGPRYKALGNSWAVPVVTWIGRRIDAHVATLERRAA